MALGEAFALVGESMQHPEMYFQNNVVGGLNLVELKATAQLIGDLRAGRIIIEDGATFVGKSEVSPNKSALQRAESTRPSGGAPAGEPKKGLL